MSCDRGARPETEVPSPQVNTRAQRLTIKRPPLQRQRTAEQAPSNEESGRENNSDRICSEESDREQEDALQPCQTKVSPSLYEVCMLDTLGVGRLSKQDIAVKLAIHMSASVKRLPCV